MLCLENKEPQAQAQAQPSLINLSQFQSISISHTQPHQPQSVSISASYFPSPLLPKNHSPLAKRSPANISRVLEIHTNPRAVRAAELRIAIVPRVIHTRLTLRTLKRGNAAAELSQLDAETGAIGRGGASVGELLGGVDTRGLVGGARWEAAAAANLFNRGSWVLGDLCAVLFV